MHEVCFKCYDVFDDSGGDFMYAYFYGKVVFQSASFIVVDVNNIGYNVFVSNPYAYELGDTYKIYLYQFIREDENSLYGFKTLEEKDMFLKLISVKGVGPKMALPMFATGSVNGICDAIERENILYLKKFPKIGEKLAKQIVLDLKGKVNASVALESDNLGELVDVLKGLGYREKDFKHILGKIDCSLTIEEQVKEALKLLLK